jgi:phage regulator Rha-like protein
MSKDEITVIDNNLVKSKIINIRNQPVILDRDVADIYGVKTKEIAQAIKNNPKKFPNNYIVDITDAEKNELVKNFDRFNSMKHSIIQPKAFTEQGLYMLATILKGDRAIEMTLQIINTFTEFREVIYNLNQYNKAQNKEDKASFLKNSSVILGDLLGNNLEEDKVNTRTTLTIDLGIVKLERTTETTKNNTKK